MTQVRVATRAEDFRAAHEEAVVFLLLNRVLAHGGEETRPTGAGVELRIRIEQRIATTDANVRA